MVAFPVTDLGMQALLWAVMAEGVHGPLGLLAQGQLYH